MTTAIMVAVAGAVVGPLVSVALFRSLDRRQAATDEKAQDVALARLEQAVKDIPERMNGKILAALARHQNLCPWGPREPTNPGSPS